MSDHYGAKFFIGIDEDGDGIALEVKITDKPTPAPHMTINHETADTVRELTYGFGSRNGWWGCGDSLEYLREQYRTAELVELVQVLDRWHLNGMRARCVHQPEADWHICPGYRCENSPGNGERCNRDRIGNIGRECSYAMGSAWLAEPLPADTEQYVRELVELVKARALEIRQ